MAIHGVVSHDFAMQEVQDSSFNRKGDHNCLLSHEMVNYGKKNNIFSGIQCYPAKTPEEQVGSMRAETKDVFILHDEAKKLWYANKRSHQKTRLERIAPSTIQA